MNRLPPSPPPSLLDTDTFSEFLRGRNQTVMRRAGAYQAAHSRFTISTITIMEVVSGWQRRGGQTRIDELLGHLIGWNVLPVDQDVAALAGRIHGDLVRTGQTVGIADPLIATTALHHNLVLVTGNVEHYQRLQPLGYAIQLDNWRLE